MARLEGDLRIRKNSQEKLLSDLGVQTEKKLKPATTFIIEAAPRLFENDTLIERRSGIQSIAEVPVHITEENCALIYTTRFSGITEELATVNVSLKLIEHGAKERKKERKPNIYNECT